MNRSFCSAVALTACTFFVGVPAAFADDGAPDAAPAPSTCSPPDGPVVAKGSKAEIAKNQQRFDEYRNCVNAYSTANMAKAKELQAQAQTLQNQALSYQAQAQATQARAQSFAAAAGGVVDAYNTYTINLNKQLEDAQKK
jgi:hypothetical protein